MFMISSADFTRPLPGTEYGLAPLSQAGKGPPPGNRQGTVKSCRADLVTAAGQFPWPPAGSYLAVCGQFLAAVVTRLPRLNRTLPPVRRRVIQLRRCPSPFIFHFSNDVSPRPATRLPCGGVR